jgi:hypothetical protein
MKRVRDGVLTVGGVAAVADLAAHGTGADIAAVPTWAWLATGIGLGVVIVALSLLVFAGVVLPAVFLKDKEQRQDAREVLKLIFNFARRAPCPSRTEQPVPLRRSARPHVNSQNRVGEEWQLTQAGVEARKRQR